MSEDAVAAAERLLDGLFAGDDPVLEQALADARDAGLPAIQVSALQGKVLHLLARAIGARRILELGTLGGFSTIWLGRALPAGGELVSLELEPRFAEIARRNLERAGLGDRARVLVGPALESVARLTGPFDLAFLDADKATMADQIDAVLPLLRSGALLVCDNVVRGGAVAAPAPDDATAQGARRALEVLASDPRVDASALQIVGAKGHDGLAIAVVA